MSMQPARNVLIVAGGWPGHRPLEVAEIMARELTREGFAPEITDSLAVLSDAERLAATSLVVLNWHMGVEDEQVRLELAPLLDAVAGGEGGHAAFSLSANITGQATSARSAISARSQSRSCFRSSREFLQSFMQTSQR